MANLELLQGIEKIKDSYTKINTSLTNLNNDKLEKSGDTMTGQLTVDYPNNGGFARIGIRNTAQTLDLAAYWEEGITQFAQVQSWDIVDNAPRLLKLNPLGGTVSINDYEAWHGGNNPASLAGNGYQKLASGFILQWGSADIPPAGGGITFPIAFPNALAGVFPVVVDTDPHLVSIYNPTLIECGILHDSGSTKTVYWFAVGW